MTLAHAVLVGLAAGAALSLVATLLGFWMGRRRPR